MFQSEVKQIEEERDRLRKEMNLMRERLHEQHHIHDPIPKEDCENVGVSESNEEEVVARKDESEQQTANEENSN